VDEVFGELIRMVRIAKRDGCEIRAVAQVKLEDYLDDDGAKRYFAENVIAADRVLVRRVFVLDQDRLANKGLTGLLLEHNEVLKAGKRTAAADGGVKWLYKPVDDDDHNYLTNRVERRYNDDWVLFGKALLVKHDVRGVNKVSVTTNPQEISEVEETFTDLWVRGAKPDSLPGVKGKGKPTASTSRKVRAAHSNVVSNRAADVVPEGLEESPT
jgi:hypothetical protein